MALKVIRDPVHDHIFFDPDRPPDKLILSLLDTTEVQRLRRIRQLGVSHLVYPGAEHTRFSHSLGVWHLARQALDFLRRNGGGDFTLTDENELAVNAAALLHDIGHGPFSHVLEHDFGGDHEKRTRELIRDSTTGVNQTLGNVSKDLPELVCRLLEGQNPELAWLRAMVTSQLDADRMDYLLRDSYFCGVGYGRYDHQYVLHTMRVRRVPPDDLLQPVWLDKACRVIEEYLFARYYMHWNVYYHRTTKGYEQLLAAICRRAAHMLKDGKSLDIDPAMARFVKAEWLTTSEHQRADDHLLMSHLTAWQASGDAILSDLSRRFVTRIGFKPIQYAEEPSASVFGLSTAVEGIRKDLDAAGLDSTYYFHEAALSAKTYDYYHPEKGSERTAVTAILIQKSDGGVAEISSLPNMDRLKAVTGKREQWRCFYVPEEHRDRARERLRSA
ncbi:MAG: HD domain-containing protein [Planctomycetes bacterium]|nr:HD domain-containing protein [Planctomycetota bacterium]